MPLYQVTAQSLELIKSVTFAEQGLRERKDLQRLLRDQVEVIDRDLFVLTDEFDRWEDSRRRIDLLAIDRDARLVVVELKIEPDGGHMELQAIRYAAMVSTMTFAQAEATHESYLKRRGLEGNARERLLSFLAWQTPDEQRFGQSVRIVLVSPDFSSEITTAVLWLNTQGLDVTCVQMAPHADHAKTLIDVRQVIPLPEAADMQIRIREKERAERQARQGKDEWTGVWYVNVGMADDNARDWEACREFGFISSGGGSWYSDALKRLKLGSPIAAYQKQRGYVGVGHVIKTRWPARDFVLPDGTPLHEHVPGLGSSESETENQEYAVGVEWYSTVPVEEALPSDGLFANQHIVCKLCDTNTLAQLKEKFGDWVSRED